VCDFSNASIDLFQIISSKTKILERIFQNATIDLFWILSSKIHGDFGLYNSNESESKIMGICRFLGTWEQCGSLKSNYIVWIGCNWNNFSLKLDPHVKLTKKKKRIPYLAMLN
jgi:hypothetical protein